MPLYPEVGAVDPAPRGVREVLDCGSPLPLSEDRFGAYLGTAPEVGRRCGAADTSAATSIARSRPVSRPRYWPSAFHGRAAVRPYQTGGSVKMRPQVRPRSEGHCAKTTIPIGSSSSAFCACLRPGPKRQRTAAVQDASRGPVRREPGRAWFHPRPDQFAERSCRLSKDVTCSAGEQRSTRREGSRARVEPRPSRQPQRSTRNSAARSCVVLGRPSTTAACKNADAASRGRIPRGLGVRVACHRFRLPDAATNVLRLAGSGTPPKAAAPLCFATAVHDAGATSSGPPIEVILTP